MTRTTREVVADWHAVVGSADGSGLDDLLADDCVFVSPVVFVPQEGRRRTTAYLRAAMAVFEGSGFRYTHETVDGGRAVLEFACDLDGTVVNGVDLIDVEDGRIVRFTVMVRPLRGMQALHARMAEVLGAAGGS